MSKTRWEKSVWGSFMSRLSRSVGLRRSSRRRSQRQHLGSMGSAELLETRITPASASFNTATGELTISTDTNGDDVRVAIGASSTNVFVNNVLLATVTGGPAPAPFANTNGIDTITFNGNAGAAVESLTITGNGPALNAINYLGGDNFQLVVSANVTPSGGTLAVNAGSANLDFGTTNVVGNLTVTNVDSVTDSGRVSVNPASTTNFGVLTITTNTPASDDITLDTASNSFGRLVLNANDIIVVEAGDTDLGNVTATGTLTITSTGDVTDSGATGISAGATSISTTDAGSITLDAAGAATNTFGVLTLTGGRITIVEDAATDLGAVTASRGDLNVTSTGAISDSGVLAISVVQGRGYFTAGGGGAITLDNAAVHRFDSISMVTTGNATLNEADGTELYTTTVGGDLIVTSLGSITDVGSVLTLPGTQTHSTILVAGDTTLNAGANAIVLDSATNNFDSDNTGDEVIFTGGNVTLVDATAIDFGLSSATIAGAGVGTLTVTAGGTVTDEAAVTVEGKALIRAVGSNITFDLSTFGSLSLFGADVSITEAGGTDLLTSTVTGNLTVVATGVGANITNGANSTPVANVPNYGLLNVTGTASFTAVGDDITILPAGESRSTFGSLTLSGNNINITEGGGTLLNGVVATGNFTLFAKDGVAPASGGVSQSGGTIVNVTGVATIDAIAKYNVNLPNDNLFGSLIFSGNNVTINEASDTVLGERSSTTSTQGSTAYGNLTLTSTGNISQTAFTVTQRFGKLTVLGTADITAGATFDITLTRVDPISPLAGAPTANANAFGVLELTTTGLDGDATILEAGPTNLGVTNISDDLTVTASGPITDSGILTVAGDTTLNAGANTIVLDQNNGAFVPRPTNVLSGPINLTGSNLILWNSVNTDLGTINATGTLSVMAFKDVSNSTGTVTVGGLATFTKAATTVTNTAASGTGATVTITTSTAHQFQVGDTVTVAGVVGGAGVFNGTFVITAVTATTFQYAATGTGAPTAFGTSTLGSFNLSLGNGAGSDASLGSLSVGGQVAGSSFANVTLEESNATNLAATTVLGNLVITSTGNVTDSGRILVSGSTTITSAGPGGAITLNTPNNDFDVGGSGDNFTFTAPGNVTIVDAATGIDFGTSSGSTLTVTAVGGDVTDDGTLTIGGGTGAVSVTALGNDIVLNDAGNTYGTLTLKGATATIVDAGALTLGPSTIQLGNAPGALTLTSGGDVTQTGAVIAGTTMITAGANQVILTNAGNRFGAINTVTATNVSITENEAVVLATTNANGSLTVNAKGAITQTGAIDANATSLNATASFPITLNNAGNSFGTLTMTGSNISITEDNNTTNGGAAGTALGASTASGTLTVNSSGTVTTTGTLTVNGRATVNGTATFAVTLGTAASSFGSVSVVGSTTGDVTIIEGNATDLFTITTTMVVPGDGDLSVTSAGAITDSGVLTIGGTTTLTAASGTAAITLNTATNNFTGTVNFDGTNVTLVDTNAIDLNTSDPLGVTTLSVTALGAISQTGDLDVTGATSFNAGGANNITLNDAGNTFGSTALIGNVVSVNDSAAADLDTSTVSGTLTLTAGGAVTQSGNLTVTGATSITANAGASDITLTATNNSFGALTLTGDDVQIREAGPIAIAGITANGTILSLVSTVSTVNPAISQTGTITAAGAATTLTASGANRDITLGDANNQFGALTINGEDVTIGENGGTVVTTATITGTLSITTSNDTITSTGNVNVAGTTTLDTDVGGGGAAITFGNQNSTFGTLILDGTDITITDSGAVDLGTTDADGVGSDLVINAGGAITDSGAITVDGTASFSTGFAPAPLSGAAITLDHLGSAYVGAVTLLGTNVTFVNSIATLFEDITATNNLSVTSTAGNITQTATSSINVEGTATINTGANDILLNTVGGSTTFNIVQLTANDVNLSNEVDDIVLGTSTLTNVGLDLADLTVVSSVGSITDNGTLVIGGTTTLTVSSALFKSITLDSPNSNFGGLFADGVADLVVVDADDVYIKSIGVVELGDFGLSALLPITGDLTIISGLGAGDNIVDLAGTQLFVTGFATFNAGIGNVSLGTTGGPHSFPGGRVGYGTLVSITP